MITSSPQMNAERQLVAPRADAMDDSGFGEKFDEVIDGRKDGSVEELGIVLVVIAEPLDGFAFGREFFRRYIAEWRDPPQPPFSEGFVEHDSLQDRTY
jgi:hypothetical protein